MVKTDGPGLPRVQVTLPVCSQVFFFVMFMRTKQMQSGNFAALFRKFRSLFIVAPVYMALLLAIRAYRIDAYARNTPWPLVWNMVHSPAVLVCPVRTEAQPVRTHSCVAVHGRRGTSRSLSRRKLSPSSSTTSATPRSSSSVRPRCTFSASRRRLPRRRSSFPRHPQRARTPPRAPRPCSPVGRSKQLPHACAAPRRPALVRAAYGASSRTRRRRVRRGEQVSQRQFRDVPQIIRGKISLELLNTCVGILNQVHPRAPGAAAAAAPPAAPAAPATPAASSPGAFPLSGAAASTGPVDTSAARSQATGPTVVSRAQLVIEKYQLLAADKTELAAMKLSEESLSCRAQWEAQDGIDTDRVDTFSDQVISPRTNWTRLVPPPVVTGHVTPHPRPSPIRSSRALPHPDGFSGVHAPWRARRWPCT